MPAERITSASPWHLIMVLDDSQSMSGAGAAALNEAVDGMLRELQILSQGKKPYFRISILAFGSRPRVLAESRSEQEIDIAGVTGFEGRSGSTDAAAALGAAADLLLRNPGALTDFVPFVFLLSDGHPDDPAAAEAAASRLKQLDIAAGVPRLVTVGLGSVDEEYMRKIASKPELFIRCSSPGELATLFPQIGTHVGGLTGGVAGMDRAIGEAAESITEL